ncbi:nitrilase-related carbon-nitrogen hydrolase [Chitinophaga ginsengisoli]|uniref:Apolipoprotein N-acyltransferase n=1 Tax=Chitinophaga ginsengisoli TaxID=363837 RepID=A0A2P8G507_9BACT|nr:nitrilase-related carbon-nitrogen hydrolase [Chitinophaga ginsengisoli]PSL29016.1 apolipoprotein N-acyltransferase [Chitinophaga ginsengisoli]
MPVSRTASNTFIAISVLFSAICWYFAFSLSGDFGYLLWVAPIPVLYCSLFLKQRWAFLIAFISYLLGRLSWLPYLLSVLPVPLAILFTVLLPLIFALIVIAARSIILRFSHWSAVFALPVLFTSFEYLSFLFSRDGTAGSIAYTQVNYLPVIQIASIAGIEGITFLLTFIPSAIVLIYFNYKRQHAVKPLLFITIGIVGITMIFGAWRLRDHVTGKESPVRIGMATIDEKAHHSTYATSTEKQLHLADLYLNEVSVLARQGAQVILMPEKIFRYNEAEQSGILQRFKDTALAYHLFIIVCVDQKKNDYYENRAWVISDEGRVIADYQKVHLFEGEVLDSVRPGKQIGLFSRGGAEEGVAICKDLDFQQYILGYGKAERRMLYVPAWDFVRDGWMHSRMAIMRSVEGGYSMARNARQGRLTINDYRGKVLFEAHSDEGAPVRLVATVVPQYYKTVYSVLGDWFGMLNVVAAVVLMIVLIRSRGGRSRG